MCYVLQRNSSERGPEGNKKREKVHLFTLRLSFNGNNGVGDM
jgi:hypothetical protein